jgi:hypothetical protein
MKDSITYLSREFRDNLSDAFQHSLEGKTVIIKRFNRKFVLIPEKQFKKQEAEIKSIEKRIKRLESLTENK